MPELSAREGLRKTDGNIFTQLFGIDPRSLAAFRIGIGLLILIDLFVRSSDLSAHYTDWGVLPRSAALQLSLEKWQWSLHLVSGTWIFQAVLFCIAAVFAVALVIGFRTRLAAVCSWILLLSLHVRNPMVLQGGDVVLRLLLFWSMCLPLAERWSVDRMAGRGPEPGTGRSCSLVSAALLLQVLIIYAFSASFKTNPAWLQSGSAVYCALMIDQFATPFGQSLLQYPGLLKALTWITYGLELGCVALALFPVRNSAIRAVLVPVMMCLHLGIALCLELGLFSLIMCLAWLPFIPASSWEFVAARLRSSRFKSAFSVMTARHQPRPGQHSRFREITAATLASILLVYVVVWNIRTTDFDRYERFFPTRWNAIGDFLGISQQWDMFAPYPELEDGWYVIAGRQTGGQAVDVLRGRKRVRWTKPDHVADTYRNQRWRKYMMNLRLERNENHRLYFSQYLCREWNAQLEGEQQLDTFDIVFVKETTLGEGKTAPLEREVLWRHFCFSESDMP